MQMKQDSNLLSGVGDSLNFGNAALYYDRKMSQNSTNSVAGAYAQNNVHSSKESTKGLSKMGSHTNDHKRLTFAQQNSERDRANMSY